MGISFLNISCLISGKKPPASHLFKADCDGLKTFIKAGRFLADVDNSSLRIGADLWANKKDNTPSHGVADGTQNELTEG